MAALHSGSEARRCAQEADHARYTAQRKATVMRIAEKQGGCAHRNSADCPAVDAEGKLCRNLLANARGADEKLRTMMDVLITQTGRRLLTQKQLDNWDGIMALDNATREMLLQHTVNAKPGEEPALQLVCPWHYCASNCKARSEQKMRPETREFFKAKRDLGKECCYCSDKQPEERFCNVVPRDINTAVHADSS